MEKRTSFFRKQLGVEELLGNWQNHHPKSLPYQDEQFQEELAASELSASGLTIKVFTAIGSWIAAIAFIGFLALAQVIDSDISALVCGIIFTLGYLLVSYFGSLKPAFEAFTLAIGLIGQCLLAGGIVALNRFNDFSTLFLIGFIVETIILLFTFSSIQRFISTILIFLCCLGFIYELHIYEFCHALIGLLSFAFAYLWINEPKIISQNQRFASFMNPVGLGLATSLILVLSFSLNKEWYRDYVEAWWISGTFLILTILYVVNSMLHNYRAQRYRWLTFAAIAILLGPTAFSPGIAAAILIVILGFYRGHYIISGLGAAALIMFTSMFYYNLQMTLLSKSILLLVVGMVFLLIRLGLNALVLKEQKLEERFNSSHQTD